MMQALQIRNPRRPPAPVTQVPVDGSTAADATRATGFQSYRLRLWRIVARNGVPKVAQEEREFVSRAGLETSTGMRSAPRHPTKDLDNFGLPSTQPMISWLPQISMDCFVKALLGIWGVVTLANLLLARILGP